LVLTLVLIHGSNSEIKKKNQNMVLVLILTCALYERKRDQQLSCRPEQHAMGGG